jgi:hypothetical protein
MLTTIRSERFDEVDEEAGYLYRGWNYVVSGGGVDFRVRSYDDEPGKVTVVAPTNAVELPEGGVLISFLVEQFGANTVQFYRGATGAYASVNLQTLEFL